MELTREIVAEAIRVAMENRVVPCKVSFFQAVKWSILSWPEIWLPGDEYYLLNFDGGIDLVRRL